MFQEAGFNQKPLLVPAVFPLFQWLGQRSRWGPIKGIRPLCFGPAMRSAWPSISGRGMGGIDATQARFRINHASARPSESPTFGRTLAGKRIKEP